MKPTSTDVGIPMFQIEIWGFVLVTEIPGRKVLQLSLQPGPHNVALRGGRVLSQ